MEFCVFFRTSHCFGKNPIEDVNSFITIKSLLQSFNPQEIVIVCDNCSENQYQQFASNFPTVYRTKLGNTASFRLCIELTEIHGASNYYFVEDDHLHLPNQKEWLCAGLKEYDFVSLYDHPDKYTFEIYKELKRKIIITSLGHFISAPSTVMTFACKATTLKETKHIFLDERITGKQFIAPRDHLLFTVLGQQGYTLGTPIPGRSTHCEKEGLSPFINWIEYAKSLKS